MKDVILINILDYEEYISETVTVLEKQRERDIETGVNYMYIELPKFRKINPDMDDKVNHW